MESGWFGGGLTKQEQAGGGGVAQEESVDGLGRHQIMVEKSSSILTRWQLRPLQQVTRAVRPPRMRSMAENLMQAAAFARVGFGRNRGQLAWSKSIVSALVSLVFGLLC
jgi:hypothetical protein